MNRKTNESKIIIFLLSIIILSVFYCHIHAVDMGDRYGTCPSCGNTMYIEYVIRQPTCGHDGEAKAMCPSCGVENYTISLPALGHEYKLLEDKKATCTEAGYKEYLCDRCGDSYMDPVPASGHSYKKTVKKEATCTENGLIDYKCSSCGNSYSETVKALGHKYVEKITKEATCEEDGIKTLTCSNCNDSKTEIIKATGHDVDFEEKAATCSEPGYKKGECKTCHKLFDETIPALGHKPGTFTIIKEATCEEDGLKKATCTVCGETVEEKIAKLGHKYPEEWTIEKASGYFTEGLESKTCEVCGEKIEELIPKKDPTILFVVTGVIVSLLSGAIYFIRHSSLSKRSSETVNDDSENLKPELEDKTILVASKDENLISILKTRHYLEVSSCEYEEIKESVEENAPDILLADVLSEESLEELLTLKENELQDTAIGFIMTQQMIDENKKKLDELIKDKKIINYVPYGSDAYVIIVRLILPILKPDLKSDESLDNIGMVADALGIPGISTLINVYTSGRDIKSTIEEGELSVSSTATVIGDMASILGLDTVGSVAGLVDDVDSIKSAISSEVGANEAKNAISGAKDMIEVVSDIIDK